MNEYNDFWGVFSFEISGLNATSIVFSSFSLYIIDSADYTVSHEFSDPIKGDCSALVETY
jgi:hypothetical protein